MLVPTRTRRVGVTLDLQKTSTVTGLRAPLDPTDAVPLSRLLEMQQDYETTPAADPGDLSLIFLNQLI